MAGIFTITAARNSVELNEIRQGEVVFTVSNAEKRPLRGRAYILAEGAAKADWFSFNGERERDFAVAGTQQYTVNINVPPDTPAGNYYFRVNMVGVANPDEDFAEGPSVSFEVPEPETKQAFPWWILLVLLAVVVIGGLAVVLLNRGGAEGGETAEPPANNQNVIHSIGEVVTVGDSTMTLNNATISNNNLVVSFTIANQGTADLPIRTRIDFGASAADGTNLQQDILRCIGNQLDTNIPPGSETTGAICYRATAAPPFTITFTSREAAAGAIVWRVE